MKTSIETIENHLGQGGSISIVNGTKKLAKKNTRLNRYHFNLSDIQEEYPSVKAFIDALPSKGFGNGSLLLLTHLKQGKMRIKEEMKLQFADQPNFQLAGPSEETPHTTPQTPQTPHAAMPQQSPYSPPAQPQLSAVQAAMGYTNVPMYEVISLNVMKERYADVLDQKAKAERELLQAESDLRTSKELAASQKIQLDSIADRHTFDLERTEANQKKWHDKVDPNKLFEQLPHLAGIIQAMKGGGAPQIQGSMGSPVSNLSEIKQRFVSNLNSVPDALVESLEQIAAYMLTDPQFKQAMENQLDAMDNQLTEE